jgi:ABC-type nitrate/sulfonate/bicarbonate transport system permease component
VASFKVARRGERLMLVTRRRLLNFAGLLAVLGAWEALHYIVKAIPGFPEVFVPSIQQVLGKGLPSLAIYSEFSTNLNDLSKQDSFLGGVAAIAIHSVYTLARFFSGMVCGLVLGIGLGLATTLSEIARRALAPLVDYLRTVPLLALITVFLIWFGNQEAGKFIFMTFVITVIIFSNTVAAIRNLDPIYARFARTLGATRFAIVKTVILPGILPELTGGVRVILATGWAIVLAAEYIAAQNGLGYILIQSQLYFAPDRMVVILLVFMLYSVLINYGAMELTTYLNRWKEQ